LGGTIVVQILDLISKGATSSSAEVVALFSKLDAETKKLQTEAEKKGLNTDLNPPKGGSGLTFTGTAAEKAMKKILEGRLHSENAILKTLKDNLSQEQKITAEKKRQSDYAQKMQDLNNQAKQALISGNYLQASMLSQQASSEQSTFNQDTKQLGLQNQIDTIQNRTDIFNQALQDLNDAIANGVTTINKTISNASKLSKLTPQNVSSSTTGAVTVNNNISVNGNPDSATLIKLKDQVTKGTSAGISAAKNSLNNMGVKTTGVSK
jgi:hypothetical protein